MKTLKIFCLSLIALLGVSFVASAQSKEKKETSLAEHHAKILQHSKALKDASGMSKADMEKHAKQIDQHLAKAKQTHESSMAKMTESEKAKPENALITKQHQEALTHNKALQTEVAKPKPEETKVKEHASKIHDAISKVHETSTLAHKSTPKSKK